MIWFLLQYTKQKTSDIGLLPFEILHLVNTEIATPYFALALSEQFLLEVKTFIDEFIVQPAAKSRVAYNMPAALEELRKGANPFGKANSESSYQFFVLSIIVYS